MTSSPPLTPQERMFYRRQTVLPEIGEAGQERLKAARVLVVGAGGLGSPLLYYLAGAGIGTLGIVDYDLVEVSNLHRQILHGTDRLDTPKTESAERTLRALNPHVDIVRHDCAIGPENAADLVSKYDVVADSSDNFATRDAVHAACLAARIPLVSAAAQLTDGLLTTFKAWEGSPNPCYRCLFPQAPPAALTPSCAEIGVLGPALGMIGSMQAIAVMSEILGLEPGLSGTLLMVDARRLAVEPVELPRRPDCPVCGGDQPPVTGGKRLTSSAGESTCPAST